jgi:hypothetical protein
VAGTKTSSRCSASRNASTTIATRVRNDGRCQRIWGGQAPRYARHLPLPG